MKLRPPWRLPPLHGADEAIASLRAPPNTTSTTTRTTTTLYYFQHHQPPSGYKRKGGFYTVPQQHRKYGHLWTKSRTNK